MLNLPDNTLDNVMINIFTSCDPHNTGHVAVSKLMEFISPFMENNLSVVYNEIYRNTVNMFQR